MNDAHPAILARRHAKRLCRERKSLVNERTRLVGRIKGLCALHGIMVPGKRISRKRRAATAARGA